MTANMTPGFMVVSTPICIMRFALVLMNIATSIPNNTTILPVGIITSIHWVLSQGGKIGFGLGLVGFGVLCLCLLFLSIFRKSCTPEQGAVPCIIKSHSLPHISPAPQQPIVYGARTSQIQPKSSIAFKLFSLFIMMTLFYTFNSSSQFSLPPTILWNKPRNTIFTLNLLGHVITVYLFGIMNLTAFDNLRWNLCCRPKGVSLFTFLALSPAFSPLILLHLLFRPSVGKDGDQDTESSFLRRIKNESFRWWSALR